MSIKAFKDWWEVWDIQVVIISSLFLQIALIFSAPLRKRMSKAIVVFLMWCAYLLADAIPIYAMGLISRRKTSNSDDDLVVFWAPFLLLHLGGPDTITAFAIEDNEFWHRHLLNLVVQCAVFIYAFYLSFPVNKLWPPTVLIFVVGFIKYTERTCCLYFASFRGLGNYVRVVPNPGPDYERLAEEYTSNLEAGILRDTTTVSAMVMEAENAGDVKDLSDLEVLQHAYRFNATLRGLIADLRFSSREWSVDRSFFLKRNSRDAFKIIEVELNFFYEILYTKTLVVQGKYGLPLRIASFVLITAALLLLKLMDNNLQGYKTFNVRLSYTLVIGALATDAISFLMIPFSDRFSVAVSEPLGENRGRITINGLPLKLKIILRKVLRVERQRWERDFSAPSIGWMWRISHRTWSESISQYNFFDYCLRPRSNVVGYPIGLVGLTSMFDSHKYVTSAKFRPELREFIFDELKVKSQIAKDLDTAREISSARGDWILGHEDCTNLLRWIKNVEFDESILMWHIATELLYNTGDSKTEDSADQDTDINSGSHMKMDFRGLAKVLSDYMLYLLIMQTTIMSTVAGVVQVRYIDTCAEARRCFRQNNIHKMSGIKAHKQACSHIYTVETSVEPPGFMRDGSKSVLFDACRLAKKLNKLGEDQDEEGKEDEEEEKRRVDKWRLICRVWIEIMCYAACRCKGTTHAAQLSKGGQLITLVWLLMAHLGLGDYFLPEVLDYNQSMIIRG